MFNENYLKIKRKSSEGEINTNIHDDGMLKEGSLCIFLSVILIDSVFKIGKSVFKCLHKYFYISIFRKM